MVLIFVGGMIGGIVSDFMWPHRGYGKESKFLSPKVCYRDSDSSVMNVRWSEIQEKQRESYERIEKGIENSGVKFSQRNLIMLRNVFSPSVGLMSQRKNLSVEHVKVG